MLGIILVISGTNLEVAPLDPKKFSIYICPMTGLLFVFP